MRARCLVSFALLLFPALCIAGGDPSPVIKSEFIFDTAPFPAAHASTIVAVGNRLISAWFGGTAESNPDVCIWLAVNDGRRWSAPVKVADGSQPDGRQFPCWNPVLFLPSHGPLLLFYKVGPNPREWWGMGKLSNDSGRTWSAAVALPKGVLGPIRAKPVELPDKTIIAGASTEHDGWVVHMERLAEPKDNRWTPQYLGSEPAWRRTGPLNDTAQFGAIQPTILIHSRDTIQILCRSRQKVITQAWSYDTGKTWSLMTPTPLPNPNAGIDVVRLKDDRYLLVYNPIAQGRDTLAIAISSDGITWKQTVLLERSPGEYSYPAAIQTGDGLVHITYTWKREKIKHVVVDPSRIK